MIFWEQLSLFKKPEAAMPRENMETLPNKIDFRLNRLERLCHGPYSGIKIQLPPRLQKGWKVTWRGPAITLSIPRFLLEAPEEILIGLLKWSQLAKTRKPSLEIRKARKVIENNIHAWIENFHAKDPTWNKRHSQKLSRHLNRMETQGKYHELQVILASINKEYFQDSLSAHITWSPRWGGRSTQSTQYDSSGKAFHLISISRGYDHPSATAAIVGGVVYHECLHIVVPPKAGLERRLVHSREFRKREREYKQFTEWQNWHNEMLPKIIRRGPR